MIDLKIRKAVKITEPDRSKQERKQLSKAIHNGYTQMTIEAKRDFERDLNQILGES